MAKPKSPLLSLGARGTIGDTLTYQKRGQDTIVREKPIPRDPYSLNQAYQRWDYRDYAYLWTLLSNSEKQIYRTKASRYHITGFSQWMRENLKTLPNLAGRWHLDERSGAITYDSSKQGNNGTIFGPSPEPGLIAGAYSFDGLNDIITIPAQVASSLTTEITILVSLNATSVKDQEALSLFPDAPPDRITALVPYTLNKVFWDFGDSGGAGRLSYNLPVSIVGAWHRFAFVASQSGNYMKIFRNGIEEATKVGMTPYSGTAKVMNLGGRVGFYYHGLEDQLSIYDRALDATEILRHSERRYPLS